MTPYVYEFLYRGADPDDPGATSAWHVIMRGLAGENWPGERVFNMQQAADAGFELPIIIAGINGGALREIEDLNGILAGLQTGDTA